MSLIESVTSKVANRRTGPKNFFDRLPPEYQQELLEIRRQFQSGELAASACFVADAIIESASEQGIAVCGQQGMRAWLARND